MQPCMCRQTRNGASQAARPACPLPSVPMLASHLMSSCPALVLQSRASMVGLLLAHAKRQAEQRRQAEQDAAGGCWRAAGEHLHEAMSLAACACCQHSGHTRCAVQPCSLPVTPCCRPGSVREHTVRGHHRSVQVRLFVIEFMCAATQSNWPALAAHVPAPPAPPPTHICLPICNVQGGGGPRVRHGAPAARVWGRPRPAPAGQRPAHLRPAPGGAARVRRCACCARCGA